MPTPSGERSVQDAIDNGKRFVKASGIRGHLLHKCRTSLTNCTCGLNHTLARLALEMDDALQKYPLEEIRVELKLCCRRHVTNVNSISPTQCQTCGSYLVVVDRKWIEYTI